MLKGVYTLVIEIPTTLDIKIGSMGNQTFERGFWVYVGSAQGIASTSLERRLQRHHRKEKKIHWHIDFLLDSKVNLVDAYWSETDRNRECDLVSNMLESKKFRPGPWRFGASDCKKGCFAHLLYYTIKGNPIGDILSSMHNAGLKPEPYSSL